MKTVFGLDAHKAELLGSSILINKRSESNGAYVSINLSNNKGSLFIEDKDLEKFAVNILKALKSKKLK